MLWERVFVFPALDQFFFIHVQAIKYRHLNFQSKVSYSVLSGQYQRLRPVVMIRTRTSSAFSSTTQLIYIIYRHCVLQ